MRFAIRSAIVGLILAVALYASYAYATVYIMGWSVTVLSAEYEDCDIHWGSVDYDCAFPAGFVYKIQVFVDKNEPGGIPNLVYEETGGTSAGDVANVTQFAAPADIGVSQYGYTYLIKLFKGSKIAADAQGHFQYQEPPLP